MAVERNLRRAHGVDHNTGGIRGIPHLKLVFQIQRHIAERGAFKTHEGELAVVKPSHVIGRADMHVVRIHLVRHHGSDGAGLGDLLGFQAGTLQHVHEVHVAADVKLVRTIQTHAAILEQTGQHAVRDGGADLRLDIVADDRHTSVTELLRPLRIGGDEHRQAVHERTASVHSGLSVSLVRLLGTNRQVGNQHVDLLVTQHLRHIHRLGVRLRNHLTVVLAQTVVGRATQHLHTQIRHVRELDGVVLGGSDRLGQVLAHLQRIDVERGDEFDVTHAVATEIVVHQAGNLILVLGVLVILNALHQRRGAIAHAGDSHSNAHLKTTPLLCISQVYQSPSIPTTAL